jgi:hypothetical protein
MAPRAVTVSEVDPVPKWIQFLGCALEDAVDGRGDGFDNPGFVAAPWNVGRSHAGGHSAASCNRASASSIRLL